MNDCIICLGEDSSDNLIEYNHCGKYYLHQACLDNWNKNECIICRKKLIQQSPNEDNYEQSFCCKLSIILSLFSLTATFVVLSFIVIFI